MAEDAALTKTSIFGGMSVCCLVCLCVFGIPLGVSGILMIIYGWWLYGIYVTGIVFVVIASLMALVGIIALILTCVYGSKVGPGSPPRQQGATVVVAPTVWTTTTTSQQQPMGYHGVQPVPQQQQVGYYGGQQHSPQEGHYGTNPGTAPAYMSTTGGPQAPAYQSTYPESVDSTAFDRPPAYSQPPKPHGNLNY